jgi:hypothetical protein
MATGPHGAGYTRTMAMVGITTQLEQLLELQELLGMCQEVWLLRLSIWWFWRWTNWLFIMGTVVGDGSGDGRRHHHHPDGHYGNHDGNDTINNFNNGGDVNVGDGFKL